MATKIQLEIGDHSLSILKDVLTQYPDSFLDIMVNSGRWPVPANNVYKVMRLYTWATEALFLYIHTHRCCCNTLTRAQRAELQDEFAFYQVPPPITLMQLQGCKAQPTVACPPQADPADGWGMKSQCGGIVSLLSTGQLVVAVPPGLIVLNAQGQRERFLPLSPTITSDGYIMAMTMDPTTEEMIVLVHDHVNKQVLLCVVDITTNHYKHSWLQPINPYSSNVSLHVNLHQQCLVYSYGHVVSVDLITGVKLAEDPNSRFESVTVMPDGLFLCSKSYYKLKVVDIQLHVLRHFELIKATDLFAILLRPHAKEVLALSESERVKNGLMVRLIRVYTLEGAYKYEFTIPYMTRGGWCFTSTDELVVAGKMDAGEGRLEEGVAVYY